MALVSLAAMRVERDAPDGMRHRPLPSIDLPLLPNQRRAARARIVIIASVTVITLGCVLAFSVAYSSTRLSDASPREPSGTTLSSGGAGSNAPSTPASDGALDTGALATEHEAAQRHLDAPDDEAMGDGSAHQTAGGAATRIVRRFGKSPGFRDALERAGATREDAISLVGSLDGLVDFRRCRPEHELVFERDARGNLEGFEYIVGITERYRAELDDAGTWKAHKINIDVDIKRRRKGSKISGSLGAALEAQGLGRSLAGIFVEVFEGQLDFYRDTREGDSFRIIVDEEHVDGRSLGYGTVHAIEYVGQRVGKLHAFWFKADSGRGDFHDADGRAMHGGWLRTPLRYDHISSPFNLRRRHPILKRITPHNGIDYAAATGTTVWAAADGVVTVAGNRGPNGNLVTIQHERGYQTAYAHLSRISRGIRPGVKVHQRQTIGAVGTTGRSTGPHLHFGLKRNGTFIDPATQLNGPGRPLPRAVLPRYKQLVRELKAELSAIPLATAPAEEAPSPPVQPLHD